MSTPPRTLRRLNRHLLGLNKIAIASGMALGAFWSSPVLAQTATPVLARSFDGDLFHAAIGPRNFLTLDAPDVLAHTQFSLGLYLDLQRFPYKIATGRPNENKETQYPLSTEFKSDLHGAIGLFDRFQLGLSLPIVLAMRGDGIDGASGLTTGNNLSTAGLGDLRLEVKGQILTAGEDDQFVLAGLVGGTAPTGKKDSYIGERGATGHLKVLGALTLGRIRLGGGVGALFRKSTTSLDANVGNQLLYAGAASVRLLRGFEVMGELAGRSGFKEFSKRYWDENPLEADLAARLYPRAMVAVTAGLGFGLGKGIGAPQVRSFVGVTFAADFRDADGDGVYDAEDRCPDQPEDRDGFKDSDGCPEADNDADGVLDAADKCPNDAEDMDQFEDEDGCPELDNDKDGIPDLNDACPNAAEDGRGKRPKDGCPSTAEDQDGDGVPDASDKCPDEPEDKDGFQDDDGCPDPDDDNDGVPDGFDNCPRSAEDNDGFEDDDGCPDPDNDKDGIPDISDKCPNKPETLNGSQDDDGCPDPGVEIVRLGDAQIEVDERIAFAKRHGQSELKESALVSLKLVALVLKGHPEITKLGIDVQAEKMSADETKRRAELIRDALVALGIERNRLVPTGKSQAGGGTKVEFPIREKAAPKQLTPSTSAPPAGPPTIP